MRRHLRGLLRGYFAKRLREVGKPPSYKFTDASRDFIWADASDQQNAPMRFPLSNPFFMQFSKIPPIVRQQNKPVLRGIFKLEAIAFTAIAFAQRVASGNPATQKQIYDLDFDVLVEIQHA